MSLTALLWIVTYCAAIVASFINPLYGTLGYLLEYYQRPELKWWGDELPALRWNLLMSIVLGVAFLLRRGSLRAMVPTPNPALRWLLGLAVIMVVVTFTVAVDFDLSMEWMIQWMKMAVIYPLLIVGTVRKRRDFNAFVAVHMFGAFTWGWAAWMDPKREGGRLLGIGSGDTYNDNEASSHLLTALPFTIIYLFTEKDWRLRGIALLALPFVMNTLILCNSRGAMLGLGVSVLAGFFMIRPGKRMRLVVATVAVLAVGLSLTDATFIERQQTTADYEEDNSAVERLLTWKGGLQLVKDRPWGAGGRGFHLLSPIYIPEVVDAHGGDPRAPHSTYIMAVSEWGVLGLVCFLGIYFSAFLMAGRVKRSAIPSEEGFFYWRAFAIQLALVAVLAASFFVDRVYGEAGYWIVALSYSLYRIQKTEQASARVATLPTVADAASPYALPLTWPLAGVRPR